MGDKYFDTRRMYFDHYGNIRLAESASQLHNPEDEFKAVMEVDNEDNTDESTVWYIMDTAWINAWLAFTHVDVGVSPSPGPCKNDRLICADLENQKWIARSDIVMATANRAGDYRRVNKETWDLFVKLYPKSGPAITAKFPKDPKHAGKYDTVEWVVEKNFTADDNKPAKEKKLKEIASEKELKIETTGSPTKTPLDVPSTPPPERVGPEVSVDHGQEGIRLNSISTHQAVDDSFVEKLLFEG